MRVGSRGTARPRRRSLPARARGSLPIEIGEEGMERLPCPLLLEELEVLAMVRTTTARRAVAEAAVVVLPVALRKT